MPELQMIPISQLQGNKANPRKSKAEKWQDDSLKASIVSHGLLQSLLVRRDEGKTDSFTVIAGNRRLRTLKGMTAPEYLVPCMVSEEASGEEAIAENFVRADIHPMDHYKSMVNLMKDGLNMDEIAERFGVESKYVEQVIALGSLSPRAQKAVKNDEIDMPTARALTVLTVKEQNKLMDSHKLKDGTCNLTTWEVNAYLKSEKINADSAEFKLDKYTGTFSTDLFGGEQWFDDHEQFWALQREIVASRVEQWTNCYGGIEETENMYKYDYTPNSITDPSRLVKLWHLDQRSGKFYSSDRYSPKHDQKKKAKKKATTGADADGAEVISSDPMTKAGRGILNREITGAIQLKLLGDKPYVMRLVAYSILCKAINKYGDPLNVDFSVSTYAQELDDVYNPEGPDGPQTAVNNDCREPLGLPKASWRDDGRGKTDPEDVWKWPDSKVYDFVIEQIVSTITVPGFDQPLPDDCMTRKMAGAMKLDFRADWSITEHFLSGIKSKTRVFEIATEMGLTKDGHMGSHIIVEPNDKKGEMIKKIVDAEEAAHMNPEHKKTKWAKYIRAYWPKEASTDPVSAATAGKAAG